MSRPLRILFVASEMSPLISTGGLAEVTAALPVALRQKGHDVRVALPCYRQLPEERKGETIGLCVAPMGGHTEYGALRQSVSPLTEVPLYLVEHEGYFGRPAPYGSAEHEYIDNAERFSFFCLALLDALPHTGWMPDVVHCHDWHAAAFPIFLRTRYAGHPQWGNVPCVFTIHNIAFQGRYTKERYAATGLGQELFEEGSLEFHGDMNLMKGALLYADRITTVSQRYAQEIQTPEYGEGLDGILRQRAEDLCGILNGVDYDVWHPERDPYLPKNYDPDHLHGKLVCKQALQELLDLPQSDAPLFGMVSRLYWQKGVDLLATALDQLEKLPFQLAILGAGDPGIEASLLDLAKRYPSNISLSLKYDASLAHLIQAGSDFFLMPSRYEPCGLGQMYALIYGAVPIVRRTGGLADSIHDDNEVYQARGLSNGLSFVPKTAGSLVRAMERAVALYGQPARYASLQQRGMRQDFSWAQSSVAYEAMFRQLLAVRQAAA
jgi:starch synthase